MKKTKKVKAMNLIDFEVGGGRGFRILYVEEGSPRCKEDKYYLYFIDGKEEKLLICMREDECILLSALLNWGVHKKLVELDKVGCKK